MLIPNEIIKSVVFIGIKRKTGELYYGGTGFFVVLHHKDANGNAWRFAYLITAKHIADGIEAVGTEFCVRINSRKTCKAEDISVALGRLGWSLRRIQKAIGLGRETISVCLKAAGIAMRVVFTWELCPQIPGIYRFRAGMLLVGGFRLPHAT